MNVHTHAHTQGHTHQNYKIIEEREDIFDWRITFQQK